MDPALRYTVGSTNGGKSSQEEEENTSLRGGCENKDLSRRISEGYFRLWK